MATAVTWFLLPIRGMEGWNERLAFVLSCPEEYNTKWGRRYAPWPCGPLQLCHTVVCVSLSLSLSLPNLYAQLLGGYCLFVAQSDDWGKIEEEEGEKIGTAEENHRPKEEKYDEEAKEVVVVVVAGGAVVD